MTTWMSFSFLFLNKEMPNICNLALISQTLFDRLVNLDGFNTKTVVSNKGLGGAIILHIIGFLLQNTWFKSMGNKQYNNVPLR